MLLKLFLVPSLIGAVTLAGRRWGPAIGGWLTALPVVAGPTLCFYAVEQGDLFAARAAESTLLGLIAVAFFCVSYAYTCWRMRWIFCLLIGWLIFAITTALLCGLSPGLLAGLLLVLLCSIIARRVLPSPSDEPRVRTAPRWDLPLRMIAAAALVLGLTSLAEQLGPNISGLLTPFPVATAVIGAFTHVQRGPDAVATYFRGFVPALNSFAMFCFVIALGLSSLGLVPTFALALATQLVVQAFNLWRMRREHPVASSR